MGSASAESIAERILVIRGARVMLDIDLALLYCVPTKQLNQQVKRNAGRFPSDFMFQLTVAECETMWSQIATTSQRKRRADNLPFAFTEHGCVMLANVLRSPRAGERAIGLAYSKARDRAFETRSHIGYSRKCHLKAPC